MSTYTIHAAPPKAGEETSDPQRFVFVRDGFHFWAFLLAPLWMLYRRLWLVLLLYLVIVGVLGGALVALRAPATLQATLDILIALLVGFEAATLWRWTLERRGWQTLGFVVGDDEESAEQRFFGAWNARGGAAAVPAPEPTYAAPVRRGPPSGADVIGLFPEPRQ